MSFEYLDIPVLPADPAFNLMAEFEGDTHPSKVSLIAGTYRDEKGSPWVLPCVKQAKERLRLDSSFYHEYLSISGSPALINAAKLLVFGSDLSATKTISSIQTISGTGANHLGASFLAAHLRPKQVFIPNPTWINHKTIWAMAGPDVVQKEYPYYEPSTRSLDFNGMISTLETSASRNDVVVLQVCAHNPTGVDLTQVQWSQIAKLVKRKELFVLFDNAYQGFATGDVEDDGWAVRHFTEVLFTEIGSVHESPGLFVAQSFSKNFGLYGERVGVLHLVVPSNVSTKGAESQLAVLARAEYSNPPRFGAQIVATVLNDPGLRIQWQRDLNTMSSRIKEMRRQLQRRLQELGAKGDWSHIQSQIGMFCYTGLESNQVNKLREDYHIYLMSSGRASICGLNENNIAYVGNAIFNIVGSSRD